MVRTKHIFFIVLILGCGLALGLASETSERSKERSKADVTLPRRLAGEIREHPPQATTEGCITCHAQIEPMHHYGTTEVFDHLKDGKDAVGLTCTGCHGGNPLPRKTSDDPQAIEKIKNEAHVRARFPNEWRRNGKATGANPERANILLERESWEYVRFINPSDLRVASQTCAGSG